MHVNHVSASRPIHKIKPIGDLEGEDNPLTTNLLSSHPDPLVEHLDAALTALFLHCAWPAAAASVEKTASSMPKEASRSRSRSQSQSRSKSSKSRSQSRSRSSRSKESPTCAHRLFNLGAFQAFLVLLVCLFTILPGVSGPGAKFFWAQVGYNQGASDVGKGTTWSLGGLGVCQVGGDCYNGDGPPGWGAVQGDLIYHLAAAPLFLFLAAFNAVLLWRPILGPKLSFWLTVTLPLLAMVAVMICTILDFSVKSSLTGRQDVSRVTMLPAFWLCIPASIAAGTWLGISAWLAYVVETRRRKKRAAEEQARRKRRQEAQKGWLRSLWPW